MEVNLKNAALKFINKDFKTSYEMTLEMFETMPNDEKLQVLLISNLIHLNLYEKALTYSFFTEEKFSFEKAYCLYRLGRLKDSLAILQNKKETKTIKELELIAQIYYWNEDYEKAIEIFKELGINHSINKDSRWNVNMWASVVSLPVDLFPRNDLNFDKVSLELFYNQSCFALKNHNYEEAFELLKNSKQFCDTLELDPTQKKEKLNQIELQLSLVEHLKSKRLSESYRHFMNAIIPPQSKFLSNYEASIGLVEKETLEIIMKLPSLTNHQKRTIQLNNAIVLFNDKKYEQSIVLCDELLSSHPSFENALILKIKCLHQLNSHQKAIELLKMYHNNHSLSSTTLLYLAQMYIENGQIEESFITIESNITRISPDCHPGMFSVLLYLSSIIDSNEYLNKFCVIVLEQNFPIDKLIKFYVLLGRRLMDKKEFEKATDLFGKALRLCCRDTKKEVYDFIVSHLILNSISSNSDEGILLAEQLEDESVDPTLVELAFSNQRIPTKVNSIKTKRRRKGRLPVKLEKSIDQNRWISSKEPRKEYK